VTNPAELSPDLFRLDGRTALVVGAGSGIGEAIATGLAMFGATVVCADSRLDAATVTSEGINESLGSGAAADSSGPSASSGSSVSSAVALDLLDPESPARVLADIGAPDVLVTTPSINVRKRIVDYADDELDRVVDLNIKGVFRLCRTFGGAMAEAGRGSMIGFSSVRSQTTEPGQGAYAATKAATVMLFKTLAAELGPAGVRANVIAPGVVETPLTRPIQDDDAWYRAYADKPILRRWAAPRELVGAAVFLASDASSYVTGTTLFVDGGWTAADGRFDPPA
jgi:NAD(P)-dependent dehydrogenase (short-subunit alcohol dehydrogenase family)